MIFLLSKQQKRGMARYIGLIDDLDLRLLQKMRVEEDNAATTRGMGGPVVEGFEGRDPVYNRRRRREIRPPQLAPMPPPPPAPLPAPVPQPRVRRVFIYRGPRPLRSRIILANQTTATLNDYFRGIDDDNTRLWYVISRLCMVPQSLQQMLTINPPFVTPPPRGIRVNDNSICISAHVGMYKTMFKLIGMYPPHRYPATWTELPPQIRNLPNDFRNRVGPVEDVYWDDWVTLRPRGIDPDDEHPARLLELKKLVRRNRADRRWVSQAQIERNMAMIARQQSRDIIHGIATLMTLFNGIRDACLGVPDGSEWMQRNRVAFEEGDGDIAEIQTQLLTVNPFIRDRREEMRNPMQMWCAFSRCLHGGGGVASVQIGSIDEEINWNQPRNRQYLIVKIDKLANRMPTHYPIDRWQLIMTLNLWQNHFVTWINDGTGNWIPSVYDMDVAIPIDSQTKKMAIMLFERM